MAIELALDPRDQATYGGPDWVAFDITALPDVPFDKLDALERQLKALWGIGFPRFIAEEMPEETLRAKRGLVWLGRKIADVDTPDLAKFHINAARVRVRAAAVKPAGDTDPPVPNSSTTSSEEKKSAKASSHSSRGSGGSTNSPPAKSGS